jgi:hypothetical protein
LIEFIRRLFVLIIWFSISLIGLSTSYHLTTIARFEDGSFTPLISISIVVLIFLVSMLVFLGIGYGLHKMMNYLFQV